jgi:hypothetical protein
MRTLMALSMASLLTGSQIEFNSANKKTPSS